MKVRAYLITWPIGGLLAVIGLGMMLQAKAANQGGALGAAIVPTRHPVSDQMLKAAESLRGKPIPAFSFRDPAGKLFTEADLKKGKPSVLVFVKNGCPCSIEAQPYFTQLAKAFGNDVQFLGIFDGNADDAANFGRNAENVYPHLIDINKSLARSLKIEASASFALIDGEGHAVKVFPGYSEAILRQANFLLGSMTRTQPREIDTDGAPKVTTAGCAFELLPTTN